MILHRKFIAATLVAIGSLASSIALAQAPNPRIALVIGDAAYPDHPLATTANDAGLIAQTLQAAGFDVVGAADLDQNSLRGALRDFLDKAAAAGPDMQAVVYLAGRGVQYDGDNYFLPVDAHIARDTDIPIQAVKISDFTHALAATPGRARIVIVDAARATAFTAEGSSVAGGLGLVDPEDGALIAFNAAPGTVTPDEPGPYGVYGKTLAGAIRAPGMPIDDVFAQVRVQVNQQTNGAVVPWSASKIQEPYAIFEAAPGAPPPPAAAVADIERRPMKSFKVDEAYSAALARDTLEGYQEFLADFPRSPQARRIRAILAARREAIFWRRAVNENSPRAYWTYLHVYPKGPHVGDARRRLVILSAEFAPPPDFAPEEYADAPPPPPDEVVYVRGPVFIFDDPDYGPPPPRPPRYFEREDDDDWRDLPPPRRPEGVGYLPVLPLAIPLIVGAKLFHKDKAANAPPPAPPALPPSFKPAPIAATPVAPVQNFKATPGAPGTTTQPLSTAKPLPGVTPSGTDKATEQKNAVKPLPGVQPLESATTPKHELKSAPLEAKPDEKSAPIDTKHELKSGPLKGATEPATTPKHELKSSPIEAAPIEKSAPLDTKHELKSEPLKGATEPATTPKHELKTAPLEATPDTKSAIEPKHELREGPLKAAPGDSATTPKHELKTAPLEMKPDTKSAVEPKHEFKEAPVKAAPVDPKPQLQMQNNAPAAVKTAPVVTPAFAAPPPPKAPPPAPQFQNAAPAAAKALPPGKPACGGPNQPPCPK